VSETAAPRTARIERVTSESTVLVELNLDGTGKTDISTTVPFYDHMLTALGKHSLIDLTVKATGDVHIDAHHTVEDTAIVIGECCVLLLATRRGSVASAMHSCRWMKHWHRLSLTCLDVLTVSTKASQPVRNTTLSVDTSLAP
jgi:hypothetical protein